LQIGGNGGKDGLNKSKVYLGKQLAFNCGLFLFRVELLTYLAGYVNLR
jgi:hypothetical protein